MTHPAASQASGPPAASGDARSGAQGPARPPGPPAARPRPQVPRAAPASGAGIAATRGRDRAQRRQPGRVRPGQQLVQRRMHARADDLSQPQRGEAEQPRTQRVVRQRCRKAGPSADRRRAGRPARSTRIAPDRLRSRICRASAGSTARFTASCAVALPSRAAVVPPASTSIATSAGVGWICSRAPPGRSTDGLRQRLDRSSTSSSKAIAAQRITAPPAAAARAARAASSSHHRRLRMAVRQFQQRTGPRARARPAGRCRRRMRTAPGASCAVSRGPLPPCAARVMRTPGAIARGEHLRRPRCPAGTLRLPSSATNAPAMAGTRAVTRPRCRSPTPSGAPGRQSRVIQQVAIAAPTATRTSPGLAAPRMRDVHGSGQPRPRSSCAVSNSGSPTTPE